MQSLGFETKNQLIHQMIDQLDKDKSGDIDFSEFLELMVSTTDKRDTKDDIMHVFNLFDHDGSGKITLDDLRRVAEDLGEEVTEAELRNMISKADTNEDGAISREEFLAMMLRHAD